LARHDGDVSTEDWTNGSWGLRHMFPRRNPSRAHCRRVRPGSLTPPHDSAGGEVRFSLGLFWGGPPFTPNTSSAASFSGKRILPSAASSPLVTIHSFPSRMRFREGGRSMVCHPTSQRDRCESTPLFYPQSNLLTRWTDDLAGCPMSGMCRYSLGVPIPPAIQSLPNLTRGVDPGRRQ